MINPWITLSLGILLGMFVGYGFSLLIPHEIIGYVIVVVIVFMLVLARLSSPKRTRRMSNSRVMFLNFLNGLVFGYGITLLLIYVASG